MGIYNSTSKGEIDTADMNFIYLTNALAKATAEGDQANIDILQAEIDIRNAESA